MVVLLKAPAANQCALPKKVYVMVTPSNLAIVQKLRALKPMEEVEFVPLTGLRENRDELECETRTALKRITERRASFMWGDGTTHQLSYDFDLTPDWLPIAKLNIDGHPDFVMYPGFEFEKPVGGDFVPFCGDHMTYSGAREGYRVKSLVPKTIHIPQTDLGEVAHGISMPTDAEIHLTIDHDGISMFLAEMNYITINGFELADVVQKIYEARAIGMLTRLDFGGLARSIPEFNIVGDPTTIEQMINVGEFSRMLHNWEDNDPYLKPVVDRVMTYALSCYYHTLLAAMF